MHHIANALYLAILFFVSPVVLYRSIRHGRYRLGRTQKLFGLSRSNADALRIPEDVVWLHGVSVGEIQLLRSMVTQFRQKRPDLALAISSSTDSGYQLAKKLYPDDFVFFAPLDFSWAVKRTFKTLSPKLILLAELEIWPNWLRYAESVGCPVVVVNGRLSERSFEGYRKLHRWMAPILKTIDWVGAQNAEYADRFIALGTPKQAVHVTGSIKFDGAEPDRDADEVRQRRALLDLIANPIKKREEHSDSTSASRTVWVAGSTQSPEEEIVLKIFCDLSQRFPELKLILVPRHPERFDAVAKLIESTGLPWFRRSQLGQPVQDSQWKIFLGDSVGELRWWWGLAEIGFVGGSFGDRGGQNMIEPCAFGVATSFGPNTKNFKDIVSLLLKDNACDQLQSPDELKTWVESLLLDPRQREMLGKRAAQVAASHRGAIDRTWDGIKPFLPDSATSVSSSDHSSY